MQDPNSDIDAGTVDLPIKSAVRRVTMRLRVLGLPRFKARLWLGARIIRFGAAVIGCPLEIEIGNDRRP